MKYKTSNSEKIKESWQKATATYRQSNPEKVKESFKTASAKGVGTGGGRGARPPQVLPSALFPAAKCPFLA